MTNTSGSIGYRTNGKAVYKLLERGKATMVLERFGQVDPMGKNKSATVRWRRLEALPMALAPIAEGIAPAGQPLIVTNIQATLNQYADVVRFSDWILDTIEDNTLDDSIKLVAQQAAETKETIRFNTLKGGTTVFFGGTGTTRGTVNGTITRGMCRAIYITLRRNRATVLSELIAPTPKIATEPVAPAFFAVGHVDLDSDVHNINGFTAVEKYSDPTKALPGEVGKVENIRFILGELYGPWLTSGASVTSIWNTSGAQGSGNADVYPILIFGKDSYGIVPLAGNSAVKIYVVNPTANSDDPVAQKGSVGWKMGDAVAILNDLWMARAEVTATSVAYLSTQN